MVFDPRPKDPLIIIGADLFFAVIGNTLPKKCGDVVRFYCEDGIPDDFSIKRFQVVWLFKHDIRGAFNLLNCPCIAKEVTPKRPEPLQRSKRKHELEMEALARLEDSTRTEEDFANVVTWWNRLDANREHKEHYHEIGRSDVPLEWGMSPDEIVGWNLHGVQTAWK